MKDLTMNVDITGLLGCYLKDFCVELVAEGYVTGEGSMREHAFNETENLFDDAMGEFSFDDVISDAIDSHDEKIKDLLFERTSDECSYEREYEIDAEIGVIGKTVKLLRDLE